MEKGKKGSSFYYILIVLMGTVMMFVGTQSSAGFSIVVNGLKESIGLSGTASSALFAVKNVAAFVVVFFANKYYEKLGLRLGVSLAFVYGIIAMVIFYFAGTNIVMVYIGAVVLGAMYALTMILPMALLMRRWFNKSRALAMAVCSAGTGLSTFILSPIIQRRISESGIRGAFTFLIIIFAIACAVFLIFTRNDPSEVGLEPYGGEDYVETAKNSKVEKVVVTESVGKAILLFTICAGIIGSIAAPAQQHFVLQFNALGYDSALVAAAYSLLGLALLIAKPTLGVLSTKIHFGVLSCFFITLYIVSYILSFLAGSMPMIAWLPYVTFIIYGCAGPITTLGYTNWIADFSTKEDYPKKVKNAQFAYQGCEIIGALLPGVIFDITGQYSLWYALAAVLTFIVLLVVARMYMSRSKLVKQQNA